MLKLVTLASETVIGRLFMKMVVGTVLKPLVKLVSEQPAFMIVSQLLGAMKSFT